MLPLLGRRLGRRLPALSGLAATALLVASLTAPASADDRLPAPAPASDVEHAAAGSEPSAEVAQQALAQVQTALHPDAATARRAAPPAPGDLTMALRDLRLNRAALPRADRAQAARMLDARPDADWTAPQTRQFGSVLVHWDLGTATSSYVDLVGSVATHVLSTYATAGYRAPKPDQGRGGGGADLFDLYLGDLGPGYYGYCDTDQQPPQQGPYDAPAYCAFDNDYAGFPRTPTQNLKVTAAHELFHAVQFAYDYLEDQWFMEASAAWAEDEVYDGINDNRQYLRMSPLAQPRESLDQFSRTSLRQYGEWIFVRYLSERYPHRVGALPVVVRRLWERAASAGGPDNYSMQAIRRELAARRTSLRGVFAHFADANRRPGRTYTEGKAYPVAPPSTTWRLSSGRRSTGGHTVRLDHLAATSVRVVPGAGTSGRGWRARFTLDLPNRARGAAAIIAVYRTNGRVGTKTVRLDRRGRGATSVPFSSRRVARVEVTLVNAGAAYKCWQGSVDGVTYSCSGIPRDDRLPFTYGVRAVR